MPKNRLLNFVKSIKELYNVKKKFIDINFLKHLQLQLKLPYLKNKNISFNLILKNKSLTSEFLIKLWYYIENIKETFII
jgi:hypothetical protein